MAVFDKSRPKWATICVLIFIVFLQGCSASTLALISAPGEETMQFLGLDSLSTRLFLRFSGVRIVTPETSESANLQEIIDSFSPMPSAVILTKWWSESALASIPEGIRIIFFGNEASMDANQDITYILPSYKKALHQMAALAASEYAHKSKPILVFHHREISTFIDTFSELAPDGPPLVLMQPMKENEPLSENFMEAISNASLLILLAGMSNPDALNAAREQNIPLITEFLPNKIQLNKEIIANVEIDKRSVWKVVLSAIQQEKTEQFLYYPMVLKKSL